LSKGYIKNIVITFTKVTMLKQFLKILILLSVFLFFEKCAQVSPLTGGERDKTPPKLVEALPANKSLNFHGSEIILRFNEFVQLKNLKNQLLISPGLKTEPEISTAGKQVVISLKKEELLPNTTYRFYFGKSIADMTEGNAIQNFEYVFSTGNYIDSLIIKGNITDAFNLKGISDAIVGLYMNVSTDSLPFLQIPDYISRSNNNGGFNFSNLPQKTFKVIAFLDNNKNYKYDGETEKIGFRDKDLDLIKDTVVNLSIFQEEPNKTFIKKTFLPYYGKALVIFNRKSVFNVKAFQKTDQANIYEPDVNKEKDSITLYYKNIKDSLKILVTNAQTKKTDTLNLTLPKINANKNKTLGFSTNVQNGVLDYRQPLQFTFLNLLDSSKINWQNMRLLYKKDTAMVKEPLIAKLAAPYKVEVNNKLSEGINYKLKIDSAAFFDHNGKYNDSANINFRLNGKKDFGKVTLKLLLNKKQAYIIQMINDKDQVAKEGFISFSLSSSNAVSMDFEGLVPGNYSVKILFDDNENKKWDTGNYLLNKQAEKVIIHQKQIKVISDWEVEEEILVK
jgi:hypothetical protein